MKAVIFGASGQDGYYLSELLQKIGIETIGVSRSGDFDKTAIDNFNQVSSLISQHKPAYIFHFAANSTTQHNVLFENHATIETGTLNILEAVRLHSPETKVFISGSGLQFENNNLPINEDNPFTAGSPYAVSRIQSVYAARYFRALGLKVYVGYFFNHDSPRRSERHMSKKIADFAKNIASGKKAVLEIGDISVVKEWTYAGDVVDAVWKLVNQEKHYEACIGSGKGYSIQDWLQVCFNNVGLDWKQYVVPKNNYTPEYKQLICDPSRILSMGWQQQVSFQSLSEMMMQS